MLKALLSVLLIFSRTKYLAPATLFELRVPRIVPGLEAGAPRPGTAEEAAGRLGQLRVHHAANQHPAVLVATVTAARKSNSHEIPTRGAKRKHLEEQTGIVEVVNQPLDKS